MVKKRKKKKKKESPISLRQLCSKSLRTVYNRLYEIPGVTEISPGLLYRSIPDCNVLAVAHLDVSGYKVDAGTSFESDKTENGETIIHSPALDDRLGVHAMVNVLPAKGITLDWLFTVDEEIGMSSADEFPDLCEKNYNWVVEFDRRGTDVVLYQFEDCPGLAEALDDAGFKIGFGSYSDIVELDSLGCGAFNVGVGYHREHTSLCWAAMSDFMAQINRFRAFYQTNKDRHFEFTPAMVPAGRFGFPALGGWSHGGCWWEDRGDEWREGYYDDDHCVNEYGQSDPFYWRSDPLIEADPASKRKGKKR